MNFKYLNIALGFAIAALCVFWLPGLACIFGGIATILLIIDLKNAIEENNKVYPDKENE